MCIEAQEQAYVDVEQKYVLFVESKHVADTWSAIVIEFKMNGRENLRQHWRIFYLNSMHSMVSKMCCFINKEFHNNSSFFLAAQTRNTEMLTNEQQCNLFDTCIFIQSCSRLSYKSSENNNYFFDACKLKMVNSIEDGTMHKIMYFGNA